MRELNAQALYHSITENAQRLAHNQEGYARHLAVYLRMRGNGTQGRRGYLRLFPDQEKVTACSDGRHSPIFTLNQEGLYAATRFVRQGKSDEPTTVPRIEDEVRLFRHVLAAIEKGSHSHNGRYIGRDGIAALEERVE